MSEHTFDSDVSIARLRDFLNDCVGSAACEEADRIREAGLLLQGVPLIAGACPDLETVDTMLSCGAAESAVLTILDPDMAFMLSRGVGGSCLATVVVEDGSEEIISEGATVALALLAAYVSLLLARFELVQAAVRITIPSSARIH
ncbi:MAG TPA: hypothetical protein VJQ77_00755 [Novosphingobium sp.]|nr:hypothetical protein [Novosphingobium sp.]